MKPKWEVQVLGDLTQRELKRPRDIDWDGHTEISIIEIGNELGHESYGWFDRDKIAIGEDCIGSVSDYRFYLNLANILCKALNEGGDSIKQ